MSIRNPVLYGNRLYSQTAYATNLDPESLNLNLTDSTSMSDSMAEQIGQVLNDLMVLTDTESLSLITHVFDSLSLIDRLFITFSLTDLKDFIVLTEWFEIRLDKAPTWSPIAPAVVTWTEPTPNLPPIWISPSVQPTVIAASGTIVNPWSSSNLPDENWTNKDGTEPV